MAKEKKGGKRLNKKQLAEVLIDYFQSRPGETLSMKQVFKNLRLTTHPMKMLALDIMEDMAWNDFLAKDGEYAYRLNTKGQVQEGTFQRKANGKNTFLPDDGGTRSATPCRHSRETASACSSSPGAATISRRPW